jgi:hypothetical protein
VNLERLVRSCIEEMANESRNCVTSGCDGHAVNAGIETDGVFTLGIDDHRVFAAALAAKLGRTLGRPDFVPTHLERSMALARYAAALHHDLHTLLGIFHLGPEFDPMTRERLVNDIDRRLVRINTEMVEAEERAHREYSD